MWAGTKHPAGCSLEAEENNLEAPNGRSTEAEARLTRGQTQRTEGQEAPAAPPPSLTKVAPR